MRTGLNTKISSQDGFALVTVLIMISIVVLLISSLVAFQSIQYRFVCRDGYRIQARYLAEGAVYEALSDEQSSFISNDENVAGTFYHMGDTTRITMKFWGGFLLLQANTVFHHQSATVHAWMGHAVPDQMAAAIVMGNSDYPLVLTGNTMLKGDVIVGPGGVKTGMINGVTYSNVELVQGEIITDQNLSLPFFDPAFLNRSLLQCQGLKRQPRGRIIYRPLVIDFSNDSLLTSDLFVYGDLEIRTVHPARQIRECSLTATGQIIIQSGISLGPYVRLTAGKSCTLTGCRLNNVLVYADQRIECFGAVSGDAQLLSSDKIIINPGVRLEWPSLLYVKLDSAECKEKDKIELYDNTGIVGSVILLGQQGEYRNPARIVMHPGSRLHGMLYSNCLVENAGQVSGLIVTNGFYFFESPTIYLNWLKNAIVDRTLLEANFSLPIGFDKYKRYNPVLWQVQ
jgi:hypothetical protein